MYEFQHFLKVYVTEDAEPTSVATVVQLCFYVCKHGRTAVVVYVSP